MNEYILKKRNIFPAILPILLAALICIATVDQCVAQKKKPAGPNKTKASTTMAPAKPAPTKAWFIFTGPDGDFTLSFPSEPHRILDTQGQKTVIRAYKITTKDGTFFSVSYQDLGGDPNSKEANEFSQNYEKNAESSYKKRGEKVVQINRLAKNVAEAELWFTNKITGDNLHRWERAIIRNGRLYILGCGSIIGNVQSNKAICRRFFDSMRLTY